MKTEFRKAVLPNELRSLMAFDQKAFGAYPADTFDRSTWESYEVWWMVVGRTKVGCCAFERHVDFQEDLREDYRNRRLRGSLYIASTGILPAWQGQGFGSLLKAWQLTYARHHGFRRVVTNTRRSNAAMVKLNQKFGFSIVRTSPDYYDKPREPTVVMAINL